MARSSATVNWPVVVGGGTLLVLAIAYLALRTADMPALQFLALGPTPTPGAHGVFAVTGGDSIVLQRAEAFDLAVDPPSACPTTVRLERFSAIGVGADGLRLVVYGTSPYGACLLPLSPEGQVRVYSRSGGSPPPLEPFAVSHVPLFRDMYLLRPVEPLPQGDWALFLPGPAEAKGDDGGPALYLLRVD